MDPQVNRCNSHMMNNLSDTLRHEHITPDLRALCWPPVHLRIDFELLMFVLKVPPRLSGDFSSSGAKQDLKVVQTSLAGSPEVKVQTFSCSSQFNGQLHNQIKGHFIIVASHVT